MAVQNLSMPLSSQGRDTECHGNPVVQKRVDGRPMQGIAAPDHHAVGGGDGIAAHGLQVVGDGLDAVRLITTIGFYTTDAGIIVNVICQNPFSSI